VFSICATLSIIEFKLFGITMAAAVLLDATVVRGVLLPAALSLLGERLWKPKPARHVRARPGGPGGLVGIPQEAR
jgi:putative drug exporter of the RND superfamily